MRPVYAVPSSTDLTVSDNRIHWRSLCDSCPRDAEVVRYLRQSSTSKKVCATCEGNLVEQCSRSDNRLCLRKSVRPDFAMRSLLPLPGDNRLCLRKSVRPRREARNRLNHISDNRLHLRKSVRRGCIQCIYHRTRATPENVCATDQVKRTFSPSFLRQSSQPKKFCATPSFPK